ncbi:MAG: UDP-N-acetylmuramate dehydrogenase [Neisseria sp.]|nr:UDP-N-acetylmuramate dehydrogenase [Neisseria sp.]
MNFQQNVSLKALNTLGLEVQAALFYEWRDPVVLSDLLNAAAACNKVHWLGGGSNTVFLRDFDGLVIHIATRGIQHRFTGEHTVLVTAAAGEVWHDFVQHTLANGWYGLENLSLIPGTVGAAPIQNIGAYGVEVRERIHRVFGVDTVSRQPFTLDQEACRFGYRDSIFKSEAARHYVITAVEFALDTEFTPRTAYGDLAQHAAQLAHGETISARHVADAVIAIRRSKLPDPHQLGNVGSFFHNPILPASLAKVLLQQYPDAPHYPQIDGRIKLAAGWLIEQAGLKGARAGGMAVHEQQALVLVNRGDATAQDVLDLTAHIQKTVRNRFGIMLQPEPLFID